MEIRFSPQQEAFRHEFRRWLEQHLPLEWRGRRHHAHGGDPRPEEVALLRRWRRTLAEHGWSGVDWPVEYGGRGATVVERMICDQELARARAPHNIAVVGMDIVAPILMHHGTPEQRQRFLPGIRTGDEIWCQGFSEPNAGSDLAALQCRAEAAGNQFIITGTKIWTSLAHFSDWCILLARTDRTAPKHKGITCFAVDMRSAGITIRPLVTLCGTHEFNELVFDGVRVPGENVIGAVNKGWEVAVSSLGYERTGLGMAFSAAYRRYFNEAVEDLARAGPPGGLDTELRRRMARIYARLRVLEWSGYRAASVLAANGAPGPEASAARLLSGLVSQELMNWMLDALRPHVAACAGGADPAARDYWLYAFLRARANTIAAGTAEIQRNILARRVLNLPGA